MFNKLKSLFKGKKPAQEAKAPKPKKPKEDKLPDELTMTPKELATKKGEPFVAILRVDLDPENMGNGAFELDWNDKFIVNLVKSGYQKKPDEPDSVIIDRWFQSVCRNIALEVYEQQQADPFVRQYQSRDIGNGRSEVS